MSRYLFVGGPAAGQMVEVADGVTVIDVSNPEHREYVAGDRVYVKTRPTDTNWRETYNPRWWEMGEPEPVPPAHVFEWHDRGWLPPEVRMIRDTLETVASRRFR